MQRVQKIISNAGHCSRRKAEDLIEVGKVQVNGKTITLGDKAENDDEITIDGKSLQKEKKRYIVLHKPIRTVCSLNPTSDFKPVTDLIIIKQRVYPTGRLDVMTTGLLILTNDGDFANKIMHPRYEIQKTYRVKLTHPLTEKAQTRMTKGMSLREGRTGPAHIKIHNEERTDISITIHEGRNRIIRRMLQYIGYKSTSLKRTHIGNITLGRLKAGEWRELTKEEIQSLG